MKYQLNDWKETIWALHQVAMLFGPLHNAFFKPRKNYLHLPMLPQSYGLSSQILPNGSQLRFDFKQAALILHRKTGEAIRFELLEQSQSSLFEAILSELKRDELARFFENAKGDSLVFSLMEKLYADTSRKEFLSLEDVTKSEKLYFDPQTSSNYAKMLYQVFLGTAAFRARLEGHMTPIVVWSEHFDLSTLWFSSDNPEMSDQKGHLNFGFSPYTPNQFDYPYLYVYAYPYPQDFSIPSLPEGVAWHDKGWRGVVIPFEQIKNQNDLAAFVETSFSEIYQAVSPLLLTEDNSVRA